ncbi:MAG: prolipoprotein diacylglyceryl transferase [Ignavibacteriaceae bacterium]|nr:prolipoprotein diacylglyceryl transferase [Ignavibacteriaceae bacterium]
MLLAFIEWSVSPEIFHLGPISVRWYGFLFAMAFVAGYFIMTWVFKKEGRLRTDLEQLSVYMIFGTVIGARLGHCLFYNPEYYLSNPIEIFKVWEGGLASHGAALGILTALYLFSKKKKNYPMLWTLDRVVIVVALAGTFIRLGNLFNSEIIGKPTDVSWAFIFTAVDELPRHPAQLYESIAYLIIFLILLFIYYKGFEKNRNGLLFGIFLLLVFTFRFFVEFVKENQSGFEETMVLNMGQILSIPFVIAGIIFIAKSLKPKVKR